MYIDIIIFAIIAGVLGANLYKLLGKKPHIEGKEKTEEKIKLSNQNPDHFDKNIHYYKQEILNADKNYSEESFLNGAKKAFRIIVSSYKENNIKIAESLIGPKVFKAFQEQCDLQEDKLKSFEIIDLRASIVNIEIIKKIAKIKVLFDSKQRNILEKKTETQDVKDIWTFEKIIGSKNPNWLLAAVTTE